MISSTRRMVSASRRSPGSSPISRIRSSGTPPLDQPQIWLESAATVSRDSPMAVPTSRTARLPR